MKIRAIKARYSIMSDSYHLRSSSIRHMVGARIIIPNDVIGISRPRSRQQLFTTKNNKERIRWAKEDRKAKLEIRYLQREGKLARTHLCQELEKIESVVKLQDFLLTELARQENNFRGLSGGTNTSLHKGGNHENVEGDIERIKEETMEALKTLV
jgi:hypothetical protein